MKAKIFEYVEKAFEGINFDAQPSTALVMTEALKMYMAVMGAMKKEAEGDIVSNKHQHTRDDAIKCIPRINERMQRAKSYIHVYSTPLRSDITAQIGDERSVIAVCRISRGNKIGENRTEVLRLVPESERTNIKNPIVYLLVRGGALVKMRGSNMVYSMDGGLTYKLVPEIFYVNQDEYNFLLTGGFTESELEGKILLCHPVGEGNV